MGGIESTERSLERYDADVEAVAELESTHPDHMISAECSTSDDVDCDPGRVAQLLSNLLGNALTHGASEKPVRALCGSDGNHFLLSVANGGEAISPKALERLFQPFVRGKAQADREGLGLGLLIASKTATAHGGDLTVSSSAAETRFTFRMPIAR